jgi:hypothetical protein
MKAKYCAVALAGVAMIAAACGSSKSASTATPTATATQGAGGPGGGGPGGGGPGGGAGATQGDDQNFQDVGLNTKGTGSGSANTADVVKAVTAFLATLDSSQRDKATYDFDETVARVTWSNYPASNVPRSGIALGDLNAKQKAAALAVVKAFSSQTGYQQVLNIMKADEYIGSLEKDKATDEYGTEHYSIAIYGTPSATEPFGVQFGGHHLARNLTYNGDNVSGAPNFTGTEPPTFESDGAELSPMKTEVTDVFGIIDGLTDDQQAAAKLDVAVDNPLKGPGEDDGVYPKSEGVLVSDLSPAEQKLVSAALRDYVGDINEQAADAIMATYESEYSKTRIAWATSTDPTAEGAYVRIDGPSAWLEFSVQHGAATPGVHYHTVYRDKTNDYGSSNPSK